MGLVRIVTNTVCMAIESSTYLPCAHVHGIKYSIGLSLTSKHKSPNIEHNIVVSVSRLEMAKTYYSTCF